MSELLTRAQIATEAGVALRTVDRWIRAGLTSGGRTGIYPIVQFSTRATRIPRAAWERFVSRQRAAAFFCDSNEQPASK